MRQAERNRINRANSRAEEKEADMVMREIFAACMSRLDEAEHQPEPPKPRKPKLRVVN